MPAKDTIKAQLELPARYELRTILKESPSNCVYKVFDASNRRDEAIKILRKELPTAQATLQFKTEFATLASLSHPNIVDVYDYGLLDDRYPYFTMEHFPGKRITEFFTGNNWDGLYDVLLQIASALHHIHLQGCG